MKVSVIVVNLKGRPFIFDCLSSLFNQSFKDFEVILVDNGSEAEELKEIKQKFPEIKLIELGKNYGFAYACSVGWKEARGKELAILNNDAFAESDWLEKMLFCLDSEQSIGGVAPRVINQKTGKLESGGIYPARNGLVYLYQPENSEEAKEVFGVCGVAGLYRGAMLKEIGFYPEDFFIYYEDADLAYRARRAGWKTVYCPEARVWHLGSKTTGEMGIKTYYLARNRLRTIARNWEGKLILKHFFPLVFYELLSFAGGFLNHPASALKARWDFLKFLAQDLKERKKILARGQKDFNLDRWLIWDYPGAFQIWKQRR